MLRNNASYFLFAKVQPSPSFMKNVNVVFSRTKLLFLTIFTEEVSFNNIISNLTENKIHQTTQFLIIQFLTITKMWTFSKCTLVELTPEISCTVLQITRVFSKRTGFRIKWAGWSNPANCRTILWLLFVSLWYKFHIRWKFLINYYFRNYFS